MRLELTDIYNCRFTLKRFPVCFLIKAFNLFVDLFLVTSCPVMAVQPCMEWIAINNPMGNPYRDMANSSSNIIKKLISNSKFLDLVICGVPGRNPILTIWCLEFVFCVTVLCFYLWNVCPRKKIKILVSSFISKISWNILLHIEDSIRSVFRTLLNI